MEINNSYSYSDEATIKLQQLPTAQEIVNLEDPDPRKNPEIEPEKLPGEDPGVAPEPVPGKEDDDDDDDDDDTPYLEPEIGDDPDEIDKKTTIF